MERIFTFGGPYGECTVKVSQEGLYYKIFAQAYLNDNKLFVLIAEQGSEQVKLGTFTPDKMGYTIQKTVAKKHIDLESVQFVITPKYEKCQLIAVSETEPFSRLRDLRRSSYFYDNGTGKIKIPI